MPPILHHRRTLRLQGYDYSRVGMYFVTIVTQGRQLIFGQVINGEMHLNRYGEIVENTWFDLPRHYPHMESGAFVVMPDHVHGIIILNDKSRGGSVQARISGSEEDCTRTDSLPADSKTRPYRTDYGLPEIVRAFKSYSARRINLLRHLAGSPVWQRNYYDHIIRNQGDLESTWLYIESNPAGWEKDDENPLIAPAALHK